MTVDATSLTTAVERLRVELADISWPSVGPDPIRVYDHTPYGESPCYVMIDLNGASWDGDQYRIPVRLPGQYLNAPHLLFSRP